MSEIWQEALSIWRSGGWAMPVLAVNAFILFSLGLAIKSRLWGKGFKHVSDRTCRLWIEDLQERKGPRALRRLVGFLMKSESAEQMALHFRELRQTELAPFSRDIRILRVCVAASPLLGLLGTVSGMFTMFDGLSMGSGGEKTLGMVASGISEALITTETGLIIALPGLFFVHHLQQEIDRYRAFLSRLQTGCTQSLRGEFCGATGSPNGIAAETPSTGRSVFIPSFDPKILKGLESEVSPKLGDQTA